MAFGVLRDGATDVGPTGDVVKGSIGVVRIGERHRLVSGDFISLNLLVFMEIDPDLW